MGSGSATSLETQSLMFLNLRYHQPPLRCFSIPIGQSEHPASSVGLISFTSHFSFLLTKMRCAVRIKMDPDLSVDKLISKGGFASD